MKKFIFACVAMLYLFAASTAGAADVKVSALPETETMAASDVFYIVTGMGSTPTSKRITATHLFEAIPVPVATSASNGNNHIGLTNNTSEPTCSGSFLHSIHYYGANDAGAVFYVCVNGSAKVSALVASTLITKSEYLPIRYGENGATPPADAAEISTFYAIGRAFDASTEENLVFWWDVPIDWSAGFKYRVKYALTADASADNTVIFGLSGCSMGDSENLDCTVGTAVLSTDELNADDDQYQILYSPWSAEVTITSIAAGQQAKLLFYRDADNASDDYASDVSVIGIEIKYKAILNSASDY